MKSPFAGLKPTAQMLAIVKDTLRRLSADDQAQIDMFRPRPIPSEVWNKVIDSSRGWNKR